MQQALQRHLLQVGYTDRLLGLLVRRLEEAAIYDQALVVVTADHGASFAPGGSRALRQPRRTSPTSRGAAARQVPRSTPRPVDERHARTTDIVPTIADVVGVDIPWRVDGRSLRRAAGRAWGRLRRGRRAGGTIASAESVAAGVLATARRNARLFGEGADSLYRIGPHRSLLGQRVADFDTGEANGVAARIDGEIPLRRCPSRFRFRARTVAGEIEAPAPTPGAVTRDRRQRPHRGDDADLHAGTGRSRFAALVPETVLREGHNDVEVFGVDASADPARLVPLGGTGQASEFRLVADGRSMVLPSGQRLPITTDGLEGRVESSVVEGRAVRIKGWAADVDDRQRVDRVLLFAGRRLLFASDTPVYRLDIGGVSSVVGLQHVGFVAELPIRDVRGAELRAFAVRGAVATELAWPFFVKYPGQREGREDRHGAQTIDVLPTIADVLGIRLPWSIGRPVAPTPSRGSSRPRRRA